MRIDWLNDERTICRVTRRRHWWSRRLVAAVLYRRDKCSRDRDNIGPYLTAWCFTPGASANEWWSGSKRIERVRARVQLDGPWQLVEDLPRAQLLSP